MRSKESVIKDVTLDHRDGIETSDGSDQSGARRTCSTRKKTAGYNGLKNPGDRRT